MWFGITEIRHIVSNIHTYYFNSSLPGQNVRQFGRRQFDMHFLVWKRWNSDSNFTEICFQESNWQYASIGSDNGCTPSRHQVIILTNADPVHSRIYAALGRCVSKMAQFCRLHFEANFPIKICPRIEFSLAFVPYCQNNKPASFAVIARHQTGDKSLSESMFMTFRTWISYYI